MTVDVATPETIAPVLLAWAEHHGRHDLPWQHDPTPYRVWVSEVMLQQTQVATVQPYFQRFLARFPDVLSLAAAALDEVLDLWTGLGYYARARNLHRAARIVVERHHGSLPEDVDQLSALPGIGRSTAGAILALSRGLRHPILDANARRVLSRYFGIDGDAAASATSGRLWALAAACTPGARVAEYTQAIMDLGSAVCTRSRPACDGCPLRGGCYARLAARQHQLPARRTRLPRPVRDAWALAVYGPCGAMLLERRPASGLWGGLWSLPMFETEAGALGWVDCFVADRAVATDRTVQRHVFTHFELNLHALTVRTRSPVLPHSQRYRWYDPASPPRIGVTKAVTRLFAESGCSQMLVT